MSLEPADRVLAVREQMNRLPIINGSLNSFADRLRAGRFIRISNNTNPILMPGSPERAELEQAGISRSRAMNMRSFYDPAVMLRKRNISGLLPIESGPRLIRDSSPATSGSE